jgi:hypothetical protein
MRLWSLHPSLLDAKGLVALWREALLAQKVLQGQTKGYRHHPQLQRFRQCAEPLAAIANYLWAVHDEATARGYAFDPSKIACEREPMRFAVSRGQLVFEWAHLKEKLCRRDPDHFRAVCRKPKIMANPLFTVVAGGIEDWERVRQERRKE